MTGRCPTRCLKAATGPRLASGVREVDATACRAALDGRVFDKAEVEEYAED